MNVEGLRTLPAAGHADQFRAAGRVHFSNQAAGRWCNPNSRASVSAHELSAPRKARDEYEKGLQLLYSKSDYRGAIVQFQHAIKDFPTFYEAYARDGERVHTTQGNSPCRRGHEEIRRSQFRAIFRGTFHACGTSERYEPVFEKPRHLREKDVDVDGGSWRGPFELARALSGLKQLEEAEKSAIEARDMKPDNPSVYLMLANIHIQRQDYSALQSDLDSLPQTGARPAPKPTRLARRETGYMQAARQQAESQGQANAQEKPPAGAASRASRKRFAT